MGLLIAGECLAGEVGRERVVDDLHVPDETGQKDGGGSVQQRDSLEVHGDSVDSVSDQELSQVGLET